VHEAPPPNVATDTNTAPASGRQCWHATPSAPCAYVHPPTTPTTTHWTDGTWWREAWTPTTHDTAGDCAPPATPRPQPPTNQVDGTPDSQGHTCSCSSNMSAPNTLMIHHPITVMRCHPRSHVTKSSGHLPPIVIHTWTAGEVDFSAYGSQGSRPCGQVTESKQPSADPRGLERPRVPRLGAFRMPGGTSEDVQRCRLRSGVSCAGDVQYALQPATPAESASAREGMRALRRQVRDDANGRPVLLAGLPG
jgi:hypothetical protein